MKLSIFIFLTSVILTNLCSKETDMHLSNGLYFGKKGWFFPPVLVFATYTDSLFQVECYLPLKGEFFKILKDTLIFTEGGYSSDNSYISIKNRRLYFSSKDSYYYKIRTTIIKYRPGKIEELVKIRKRANPFKKE